MKVSLTGIKPTGQPHIGNYLGAIKPALKLAEKFKAHYFIADYHALNTIHDAETLRDYSHKVCATWLASGLNPDEVLLYRQSDVPQVFELNSFLMNFVAKGLMNRAHGYKAISQENLTHGKDVDFQINMGLYTYPILMASDILLFDTQIVPVGRDQVQHVEYTSDIAKRVNHIYNEEVFKIPQPQITSSESIQGIDGRKMSKSYNNTIPLYMESKKLNKLIMRIKTNSQGVEEIKDPSICNVFALYLHFANEKEQENLRQRYLSGGLSWKEAKEELFIKLEDELGKKRNIYFDLLDNHQYLDKILAKGAEKAQIIAQKTIDRIRRVSGIDLDISS